MKKKILLRGVLCLGLGFANLLTMPALADTDAANWNGTYAGGHIGYAWNNFNGSSGVAGPNGSSDNVTGGADVGNNWQFNHYVVGAEGDADILGLRSRNPSATDNQDWMSTIRARAGYAMGRYMPYATVGLGMTDETLKAPGIGSTTGVEPGVAAGGGVDMKLAENGVDGGGWFGRVEYLYVNVPTDTSNIGGATVKGGSDNNMIRAGLNYQF